MILTKKSFYITTDNNRASKVRADDSLALYKYND